MPFDVIPQVPRDPVLQVLVGARIFVARGWCRGARARDAGGRAVAVDSPAAVGFCIVGALHRAGIAHPRGLMGALWIVSLLNQPAIVSDDNDRMRDAGEAVAFLDRAIEYRRAQRARPVAVEVLS